MAIIGRRNVLRGVRSAPPGFYLDGGESGEILLPNRYIPRGFQPGDTVEVFVYLDSDDRLVATTETPRAMVGEVATLRVVSVHQRVGAFLDWGLAKDLLLPFREQTAPVHTGQEVVVGIYLDEKTNRIVATMRLNRHLNRDSAALRVGQKVQFLIASRSDLGFNAVVEGKHPGLIFHDRLATPPKVGETLTGYIRAVRPDGKIDLALDQAGYKRVASLTDKILKAVEKSGGKLAFDDDSSPEDIRAAFGVSKKAFKQALGALYKARKIAFTNPGIALASDPKTSGRKT
jgi:predicted RNA-binding protein (virulence factor B family)